MRQTATPGNLENACEQCIYLIFKIISALFPTTASPQGEDEIGFWPFFFGCAEQTMHRENRPKLPKRQCFWVAKAPEFFSAPRCGAKAQKLCNFTGRAEKSCNFIGCAGHPKSCNRHEVCGGNLRSKLVVDWWLWWVLWCAVKFEIDIQITVNTSGGAMSMWHVSS